MNMNRWPFWLQVFNIVGLQPHFKSTPTHPIFWGRGAGLAQLVSNELDQLFLHPWFSYIIFFYASVGVASNASSARCSSVSAETRNFVGWKVYISNASEQSRLFFCSLHGWNIKLGNVEEMYLNANIGNWQQRTTNFTLWNSFSHEILVKYMHSSSKLCWVVRIPVTISWPSTEQEPSYRGNMMIDHQIFESSNPKKIETIFAKIY